jgi:glyoxylase-like metal-dependent hydrolase (beta-lactamase superfamily II)
MSGPSQDGEGWAIVDTGVQTRETSQAWRDAFAGALGGKPVTRVICTHLHPDHVGLAGWMTRKFDCRLWMTRLEYFQCRMLVADTGREAPEDGVKFFHAAGWDEDAIENYKARFGGFGKAIYALPDSYRRLSDGEDFDIGGKTWRVVTGQGHSPDHACLWCPELNVLISGDQVLPRISSNVSVFPTEPDADPLERLAAVAGQGQGDRARRRHRPAGSQRSVRGAAHPDRRPDLGHERGLARLEKKLAEPKRVVDTFGALFARTDRARPAGHGHGRGAGASQLPDRSRADPARGRHEGVAWYAAIANADNSSAA